MNDVFTSNLFNRASPWADVDSYIPYEGRVDVKMKQSCAIEIRIPEWVQPEEVSCSVNGFEQELLTSIEDGNLVIRNLLVKDYPIILRLSDR